MCGKFLPTSHGQQRTYRSRSISVVGRGRERLASVSCYPLNKSFLGGICDSIYYWSSVFVGARQRKADSRTKLAPNVGQFSGGLQVRVSCRIPP